MSTWCGVRQALTVVAAAMHSPFCVSSAMAAHTPGEKGLCCRLPTLHPSPLFTFRS